MGYLNIIGDLTGLTKCPHCSIANPQLKQLWETKFPLFRKDVPSMGRLWAAYQCTSCADVVLASCKWSSRLDPNRNWDKLTHEIEAVYPATKAAHEDVPEPARTFLQQAFDTLHAPDAAAVMAGSAVDAMLKKKGLVDGNLYSRIDKALVDNLLTKAMANWAHEVRLGSNRPRHADEMQPHVTSEQAKQSVDFAEALGNFLFVLSARIERGLEKARPPGVR
ncbi:MAG: hypothetical protein QOF07_2614 [Bradyrhizobium sp.]|nr:hypothetical protein [Bradyrhizobium sp.]